MLIQDYDWKVGDRVKIRIRKTKSYRIGRIIGIGLEEQNGKYYFHYIIKLSDTESIRATRFDIRPIRGKEARR